MRCLPLGLVLASAALQVQAPIFRGGVCVVPVGLVLEYTRTPWVGLTSADLRVLLDKTELSLLEVARDEQAPNRYTMFFQPPDHARDGKTHVLQVRVKRPKSNNWTTLPFKAPITLPAR